MFFDVVENSGAHGYFAGEGRDEWVLGGHGLQITDPALRGVSGGPGQYVVLAAESWPPGVTPRAASVAP